nr:MAG TPA: hypothetical protein [Caudoviricetes sp.]
MIDLLGLRRIHLILMTYTHKAIRYIHIIQYTLQKID